MEEVPQVQLIEKGNDVARRLRRLKIPVYPTLYHQTLGTGEALFSSLSVFDPCRREQFYLRLSSDPPWATSTPRLDLFGYTKVDQPSRSALEHHLASSRFWFLCPHDVSCAFGLLRRIIVPRSSCCSRDLTYRAKPRLAENFHSRSLDVADLKFDTAMYPNSHLRP